MSNNVKNDELYQTINNLKISEEDKSKIIQYLLNLRNQVINIMITGATGCGKSSTINALFGTEVAKVGCTPDPETMEIEKYNLKNLVLWDSPGLGDGKEADTRHAKNIVKKLNERDSNGNLLIDLVLVILDGSSRDLGTSYQLINEVIIPNLGTKQEAEKRLLVAINQADVAMKGKHWDFQNNRPDETLDKFLNEKITSVKSRIKDSTGISVDPIYYSAGYKENGEAQQPPYNLSKLMYYIVKMSPKEKRIIVAGNMNDDVEVWKDNDKLKDYNREIRSKLIESIVDCAETGADVGKEIGSIFGKAGEVVGGAVGGVVGGFVGLVKGIWGSIFS